MVRGKKRTVSHGTVKMNNSMLICDLCSNTTSFYFLLQTVLFVIACFKCALCAHFSFLFLFRFCSFSLVPIFLFCLNSHLLIQESEAAFDREWDAGLSALRRRRPDIAKKTLQAPGSQVWMCGGWYLLPSIMIPRMHKS